VAYSRFIGLVALQTRGVVLLAAVAFAGSASVQLPAVTKTASRDNAAANEGALAEAMERFQLAEQQQRRLIVWQEESGHL
jgi:cellobiose-specific phosphotransferase system component IIA